MKSKLGKIIIFITALCLTVFTFFQPYQIVPEKMKITNLSSLAYASSEDGNEEKIPNDPIDPPLNFWEWMGSVLDRIGYNGMDNN